MVTFPGAIAPEISPIYAIKYVNKIAMVALGFVWEAKINSPKAGKSPGLTGLNRG